MGCCLLETATVAPVNAESQVFDEYESHVVS